MFRNFTVVLFLCAYGTFALHCKLGKAQCSSPGTCVGVQYSDEYCGIHLIAHNYCFYTRPTPSCSNDPCATKTATCDSIMSCWSDDSDLKQFCEKNGDGCYWGALGNAAEWTCCCSGDYCNDCASGADCSPKPMPEKCTQTDAPPTQQIFPNSTSTGSTKKLDNHHNQAFATKSLTSIYAVLSIIYIIMLF